MDRWPGVEAAALPALWTSRCGGEGMAVEVGNRSALPGLDAWLWAGYLVLLCAWLQQRPGEEVSAQLLNSVSPLAAAPCLLGLRISICRTRICGLGLDTTRGFQKPKDSCPGPLASPVGSSPTVLEPLHRHFHPQSIPCCHSFSLAS